MAAYHCMAAAACKIGIRLMNYLQQHFPEHISPVGKKIIYAV
jgi:hypothetical protein